MARVPQSPQVANETRGVNLIPLAVMSGGWLAPLLIFWLNVWGPMRPFHYPQGDLGPPLPVFALLSLSCVIPWWLPRSYYRVRPFERNGRLYEALGVRVFRRLVPDGDFANRWRRRKNPGYRVVVNRAAARAFLVRTEESERGHLVLLLLGLPAIALAWQVGWYGWAIYLAAGNVLVNLYPVLLQRYTRGRLQPLARTPAPPRA
jgi:hypothetical protein